MLQEDYRFTWTKEYAKNPEEVFYGCFTHNSVSVLVVYSRTKLRLKHV